MSLNSSALLHVPSARRTRVIVADPYPVIVQGVRKMLEDEPRFQVVAEASTMPSLRKKLIAEDAEVALVDWSMASQDLAATTALLQSDLHSTSMIFLTVSENSQEKREMVKLGAHGFLSKWTSARKLQRAVFQADERRLAPQSSVAEAGVAGSLLPPSGSESEPHRIQRLTHRERQLLPLVCSGLKNKEIALQLGVAETTVWHHLTAIFTKLQVNDRLGVATFVYRHHLVPPGDGPATIPGGSANGAGHASEPFRSGTLKYPPAAHWTGNKQRERSLHGSAPGAAAG